ncbi:MAG: lipocalin family protein [Deltaproteobacteria bacterium]|nr:lipocalin family protein [Deltaproteobacteria bacterium]
MDPALNPIFWLYWFFFLIIAALIAVVSFFLVKMSRVNSPLAVIIAMGVFILISCGLPLIVPPSPRTKPSTEDIIGVWTVSTNSARKIQTLEFKENGTFVMINMPTWWLSNTAGPDDNLFDTGSGTWNLIKDSDSGWLVKVHLEVVDEQNVDIEKKLYLMGSEKPYNIYIWYRNDPDEGVLDYEKAPD